MHLESDLLRPPATEASTGYSDTCHLSIHRCGNYSRRQRLRTLEYFDAGSTPKCAVGCLCPNLTYPSALRLYIVLLAGMSDLRGTMVGGPQGKIRAGDGRARSGDEMSGGQKENPDGSPMPLDFRRLFDLSIYRVTVWQRLAPFCGVHSRLCHRFDGCALGERFSQYHCAFQR